MSAKDSEAVREILLYHVEARKGLDHLQCKLLVVVLLSVMLVWVKILYNTYCSLCFNNLLASGIEYKVGNNFTIMYA